MKLLYVCSDFGIRPRGTKGASIHLRSITRGLCELGHDVSLLSPHAAPGRGHPARPLLSTRTCPPARWAEMLRLYLKQRDLSSQIALDLRPLLYNPWVVSRVIKKLKGNPPDAILERLSLLAHVGVDLSCELKCPLFVEVNALLSREMQQFRGLELVNLARDIEQRVLARATGVFAVSEPLVDMVASLGVPRSRIHVVPNGADLTAFSPNRRWAGVRRRLGLEDAFVIGFVGSLKVWHGVDVLLDAFRRLHAEDTRARLLIVGSGPMQEDLQAQAAKADVADSVLFTGALDHRQIPRYLAAMDVAVAPYRSMDQFYFSPIKLFEYMAAGCCVVASRLGQIDQIITDRTTGLLVPPDDAEALATALSELRSDPARRTELGTAARRAAEQRFSWERAARTISELIEQSTRHPAGARPLNETQAQPLLLSNGAALP
jgi:glycosyltransferase involved in cell wall biosynthesis